jgi:hypothetical protein
MSIPYIPGNPTLGYNPAIDNFQACIQAVIEEGINSNSLVPAAEDEEAVRAWLENPREVLRRDLAQTGPLLLPLAPAVVRTPSDNTSSKNPEPNLVGKDEVEERRQKVERGDEKAEEEHPVHSSVKQDQPTQNTTP